MRSEKASQVPWGLPWSGKPDSLSEGLAPSRQHSLYSVYITSGLEYDVGEYPTHAGRFTVSKNKNPKVRKQDHSAPVSEPPSLADIPVLEEDEPPPPSMPLSSAPPPADRSSK